MIVNQTKAEIEAEILRLQAKLAHAQERLARREIDPDARTLATALHADQCRLNHIDQCGWQLEKSNWEGYSHRNYLMQAKKTLKNVDLPAALAIIVSSPRFPSVCKENSSSARSH